MTLNLVTRDFINPDFNLYNNNNVFTKKDIVNMIRYWKILLWEKYSARPGMKIGIAMCDVDPYQISLIFAASELGLSFVLLDHPISKSTIHKTKASMFAPIDIGIVDKELGSDKLHQEMMEKFCRQICFSREFDSYSIKDHSTYTQIADEIFCKHDDVLILASTSGTTSKSRPVPYTQSYTANLAIRNAEVFNYKADSNIVHTRNMHHASSMLIHFLPTIYKCSNHWHQYTNYQDAAQLSSFINLIVKNRINFCMLCNIYELNLLFNELDRSGTVFDHNIDFNISGFYLDEYHLVKAKEYNLSIVSTFGSVDTAVPLFINCVGPKSELKEHTTGLIGIFPNDGFYTINISNLVAQIDCKKFWAAPRTLNDLIEQRGQYYYHHQRDTTVKIQSYEFNLTSFTNYIKSVIGYDDISVIVDKEIDCLYLVVWDNPMDISLPLINQNISNSDFRCCLLKKIVCLNKENFVVDTKVSVDQLRGYLQSVQAQF